MVKCYVKVRCIMKKIILLLISITVLFSLTGCSDISTDKTTETNDNKDKVNVETIYADNEAINLFINKYNSIYNPKITSEMLSKKHIGGRDRDDVVVIANDKLEIIVYDNYSSKGKYNMSVYVGYLAKDLTPDDYKEYFVKYIKMFDETLSDDDINNYWNDMISSYHSSYKINDIDILTSTNDGKIQYFKLTNDIEL